MDKVVIKECDNMTTTHGVHLHLIYVYTCENPLLRGGGVNCPSFVEKFPPYKHLNFYWMVLVEPIFWP